MTAPNLSAPIQLPPFAGGQPLNAIVADQAADWLTLLMSGEASSTQHQQWQQWRAAHPDHERAWLHIESVVGKLRQMEPHAARKALMSDADGALLSPLARRKALRMLLWGIGTGALGASGLLATRTPAWQQSVADYRSGIGQQRLVTLEDGTSITLNSGSAIDVHFNAEHRLVRLLAGEMLVATGHRIIDGISTDDRPFVVATAEGEVRALGTRFTVRQRDNRSDVAVLESAVEITPLVHRGQARLLRAGERLWFTSTTVSTGTALDDTDTAWLRGQIIADNMLLGDFISELGRYRRGLLRCDPAVASLRFSGVFPLEDTDRILATLPNVLPVQVQLRTRYWVTVLAAR